MKSLLLYSFVIGKQYLKLHSPCCQHTYICIDFPITLTYHKPYMATTLNQHIRHDGGNNMAKCPKCGTEVSSAKKRWTMAGRPDKTGKRMQLEIGLFDCPRCKKPFRAVLSKRKI